MVAHGTAADVDLAQKVMEKAQSLSSVIHRPAAAEVPALAVAG